MLLILPLIWTPPYERSVAQDVLLRELVSHLRQLREDRAAKLTEIENEINKISVYELDDEIIQNKIIENFVSQFKSEESE